MPLAPLVSPALPICTRDQCRVLYVAGLRFWVLQLPQEQYCLRLSEVVSLDYSNPNMPHWLRSHRLRSTDLPNGVWVEGLHQFVTPVSLDAAMDYWQYQASRGSYQARKLVEAFKSQSLPARITKLFQQPATPGFSPFWRP